MKNLTPLVVGNVLGGKNLLIFDTIIVTIHLTDLLGNSVLDVTPNHNLSPSKFFWVNSASRRAPEGRRQYWRRLGWSSTDDSSEKSIFRHFSAVQPSVRLWALAYATRFLSCLLFSAGFWAALRSWRPLRARIRRTVLDETGVAGVHSSWSCEVVDMGLAFDSRSSKLSSRPIVLRGLPDLGLSWTLTVSW